MMNEILSEFGTNTAGNGCSIRFVPGKKGENGIGGVDGEIRFYLDPEEKEYVTALQISNAVNQVQLLSNKLQAIKDLVISTFETYDLYLDCLRKKIQRIENKSDTA